MTYKEWKKKWFYEEFINMNYDWLYFPETDKIVSFHIDTGLEYQMTSDYWRDFSRNCYTRDITPLSVDQKLNKIIRLLEER